MSTSAQQAALNVLATFLGSNLSGGVSVEPRWPDPNKALPPKAVTIIRTGPREDTLSQPEVIAKISDVDSTHSVYRWRVAYCEQPIQLDVWTTDEFVRDDLEAQLDNVLHSGDHITGITSPEPVRNGLLLQLNPSDGWSGTVEYLFDAPEVLETPDQIAQVEYRTIYQGKAFFELTVDATSARLAQIQIQQKLYERDADLPGMTANIVTIT